MQRMLAEPDPRQKLAIYASAMQAIQTRMAPLLLALRDASSTEPEAEQVWIAISERRAANMRRLVVDLGEGVLRPELSDDTAADIIWATASSEVFILLTTQRRWSLRQYEDWLYDTWCRLLLDARGPPTRSTTAATPVIASPRGRHERNAPSGALSHPHR